ncbi:hypothetical protein [Sphingomonas hankookensis]
MLVVMTVARIRHASFTNGKAIREMVRDAIGACATNTSSARERNFPMI